MEAGIQTTTTATLTPTATGAAATPLATGVTNEPATVAGKQHKKRTARTTTKCNELVAVRHCLVVFDA